MIAIRHDDCTLDPRSLWGAVDGGLLASPGAIDASTQRHKVMPVAAPGGKSCRELWTQTGDDFYQMRTELGRNDWRYGMGGGQGTFMLYAKGMTTTTSLLVRLGEDYPIYDADWSHGGGSIVQQKQAQPHGTPTPDVGPALTLNVYGGKLRLIRFWQEVWSCPIEVARWTRITWTVCHRDDPSGWTVLGVGPNQSSRLDGQTLLRETIGTQGTTMRLPIGAPTFGHLRVGPYHAKDTTPRSLRVADIKVSAA